MKKEMTPKKMIEMFTYSVSSKLPIGKVTEKVPVACEKHKFALLQTYVYHDIVAGKGFPIDRKVYIYEICQAKTAAQMLTGFPHFSLFMPCKLAIYENIEDIPDIFYSRSNGHSVKPQTLFDIIDMKAEGNKIELFARKPREGWDVWGNEVESSVAL